MKYLVGLGIVANLIMSAQASAKTLDIEKRSNLKCFLTDMEEFRVLSGTPDTEKREQDGGTILISYHYQNGYAKFRRFVNEEQSPFVLIELRINGEYVDIGCASKLVLRNEKDLNKLTKFAGMSGVSLAKLDLTNHFDLISKLPFDSETEWPTKIPPEFDPTAILEAGKNPGLGIRSLHKDGIDGRGVSIAIIDQPLLLGHREYRDRIVYYDKTESLSAEYQMHGPPVASIAVGKTIGVAPEAKLYYFAVPMWMLDNRYYAEALEKIIALNKRLSSGDKIRAVSISFGGFKKIKNYKLWQRALKKAESHGIYVSTCSEEPLDYANLILNWGRNPDVPESYSPTEWIARTNYHNGLYVPGGNRTVASFRGIDVYQSDREAGLSWSAPYIAGLAALVFQVNPDIKPQKIIELIKKTATSVSFGKIVNPQELIVAAKSGK